MKILLTGSRGQLGRELERSLACLGEVVACDRATLDLADADAVRAAVRSLAPDVVVNAGAFTAVDAAETDEATATAINGRAPAILAEVLRESGGFLVHFSTDYVFDGTQSAPYREEDPTAPLSAYGRSKLSGERAIAASGVRHLIFRTSWVFGLHGANFMKTMLRLGRERDELRVIGDQVGAPTWTRHLADAVTMALSRRDAPEGLFHLAGGGETSWHGYAEAIFADALALGLTDRAPVVHRIASADYPLPAKRPSNSRLACAKATRELGITIPDWRQALRLCLADAIH